MMRGLQGLILAGGCGARLAAEGVETPKALVEVAGRPQVVHLIETFVDLGCASVTCMVRDDVPGGWERAVVAQDVPVTVLRCRTPSALHTLALGLSLVQPGPVFCTLVDTVMAAADWRRVYRGVVDGLDLGALAVLAVTPFVDDERPVYVTRDAGGMAIAFADAPVAPAVVTGGVYGFAFEARLLAGAAALTLPRLRDFLRVLVERGGPVATVEVPRIIDLDHKRDLDAASAWLGAVDAAAM